MAHVEGLHKESHIEDLELPSFHLSIISRATNNFSLNNKLGEGGYGPVYKVKTVSGSNKTCYADMP